MLFPVIWKFFDSLCLCFFFFFLCIRNCGKFVIYTSLRLIQNRSLPALLPPPCPSLPQQSTFLRLATASIYIHFFFFLRAFFILGPCQGSQHWRWIYWPYPPPVMPVLSSATKFDNCRCMFPAHWYLLAVCITAVNSVIRKVFGFRQGLSVWSFKEIDKPKLLYNVFIDAPWKFLSLARCSDMTAVNSVIQKIF